MADEIEQQTARRSAAPAAARRCSRASWATTWSASSWPATTCGSGSTGRRWRRAGRGVPGPAGPAPTSASCPASTGSPTPTCSARRRGSTPSAGAGRRRRRRGLPSPRPRSPTTTGDVTGVAGGDTRFQVFARLYNVDHPRRHHPEGRPGPTTTPGSTRWSPLYRGADWHEREAWEMYGVRLRRPPRPAPPVPARRVRGLPAAQGLPAAGPHGEAVARPGRRRAHARRGADGEGGRRRATRADRWPSPSPIASAPPTSPARRPTPGSTSSCEAEGMTLNIGPQHPATHGTLRIVVRLDGEQVAVGRAGGRLHAPGLREADRGPHLPPGHHPGQPHRLAGQLLQRGAVHPGRREADGRRGAAPGPVDPHASSSSWAASPTSSCSSATWASSSAP